MYLMYQLLCCYNLIVIGLVDDEVDILFNDILFPLNTRICHPVLEQRISLFDADVLVNPCGSGLAKELAGRIAAICFNHVPYTILLDINRNIYTISRECF